MSRPIVKAIAMHPMSKEQLESFQNKVNTLLGREVELSVQVHIPPPESASTLTLERFNSKFNPELKRQWVRL